MRLDAEPGNSGAISSDGGFLCVCRAKKSEYEIPQVQFHEGLLDWRAAHLDWHQKRHPKSPRYFPGLRNGGADHVLNCALTQKFKKLFEQKLLAGRFSSHGMRALSVRIRRSQGVNDAPFAVALNQHGGVATLVKCYVAVPPWWRDGNAPKLAWIPKVARAWTLIQPNN